jgi:hypothetical protein
MAPFITGSTMRHKRGCETEESFLSFGMAEQAGNFSLSQPPEFVAKALPQWIVPVGAKTSYIDPGSPGANVNCESFSAKFLDELLNGGSSTR